MADLKQCETMIRGLWRRCENAPHWIGTDRASGVTQSLCDDCAKAAVAKLAPDSYDLDWITEADVQADHLAFDKAQAETVRSLGWPGAMRRAYGGVPDVPVAKRLYCFYHPEHERGHDGCQGHGVSGPQRVDALIGQVRWWRQVASEATRMRDDMAAQARAIARGVSPSGDQTFSQSDADGVMK